MINIEAARLKLRSMLKEVFEGKLYYQPPGGTTLEYPCIVYSKEDIGNVYADNYVFRQQHKFKFTYMDPNINNMLVDKLSKLPMCSFERYFANDNINHDVFIIYIS